MLRTHVYLRVSKPGVVYELSRRKDCVYCERVCSQNLNATPLGHAPYPTWYLPSRSTLQRTDT